MSVNASKHELLQLIYRHLKDHGFHTAADELQKHSPQVEKETPTSLLDVYNSWLKQPFSTKHSDSQKRRTPAKATKIQTPTASNHTHAEEDSSSYSRSLGWSLLPQVAKTKAGVASPQFKTPKRKGMEHEGPDAEFTTAVSPFPLGTSASATPKKKKNTSVKKIDTQKKSVPAKRKRNGSESAGSVIKKSKSRTKDKSAGGDDSDSDSSLDVEKWKKRALHMTDRKKDGEEVWKMQGAVEDEAGEGDEDRERWVPSLKERKTTTRQASTTHEQPHHEDDIVKMNTINALDSTTPQPKKKRVRKPRAKPPVLTSNPSQKKSGTVGKNEKAVERGVTESPTKNSEPKKSRQKKTAGVTSSAIPKQEEHLKAVEDRPTAATLSPSKQTPVKKTRQPETPRDEKNHDTMSEPKKKKKKKKKKESSEDKVEEKANETSKCGKEKDSKEKSKKKEATEQEFGDRPVEEKKTKGSKVNSKKTDTEDEMMEKNKNGIGNDILQTMVEKKKAKKKKRKTDRDENSEKTAKEDNENAELVGEEAKQNRDHIVAGKKAKKTADSQERLEENESPEQIVKEKKAKKKTADSQERLEENESPEQIVKEKKAKKKTADSQERLEENESPEQIVKEKKAKKNKKEKQSPSEENSEQTAEEKKKNKKKADPCDEVLEHIAADREEMPNQITEVKQKKKKDSLKNNSNSALMEPLPSPNSETPSTEKKKKKHKMMSAEMTETPVRSIQDNTASEILQTPSSKKKKKSSKSTNS